MDNTNHLRSTSFACLLVLVPMLLCTGCYNGEVLIERARHNAVRTRLVEIDLGKYRVTMPQDNRTAVMTEVDIHLFGEAKRYQSDKIEDELEQKQYILQDETATTLRGFDPQKLTDPDLEELRAELLATMNNVLSIKLEEIGFYSMRIMRH